MRRFLPILRRFYPSPMTRSRLRWLVIGCVLATIGGSFVWRVADARLSAQATRQARAGDSAAVIMLRDDWFEHVVPVALTTPGSPGEAARAAAAAKINQAASRAAKGDIRQLDHLAPRLLAVINSVKEPSTVEGARWGEWVLRRLAAASERLPAAERVHLLVKIDDTLARLAMTPRTASRPQEEVAAVVAMPVATPVEIPPVAAAAPPKLLASELTVKPEGTEGVRTSEAPPPLTIEVQEPPRVATEWRRPERGAETTPAEPAAIDSQALLPTGLGDRDLLSEALRIENLLTLSPDGAPRAMGPSRIPTPLDADEAATRARLEAVRSELVTRGYAGVSRQQVEGLLLPAARERAAFIERLLTDRSGDPARVLLLMAGDESPEVRAAAISALGGSSNRELVKQALELAMRDQDLRVGRLVEPIRERLR